jgi:hypothetical protein
MEWNAARLKFPILSGETPANPETENALLPAASPFANMNLGELCKVGFGLTWPLALVALLALGLMLAVLLRH